MCRNQLAKVYKHLGNKECLRKNQRKVYAKDLDAACWVKYPHNHKSCYKYCTNQRLAEVISRHLAHDDVAEDDVAIGRKADGIVKVLAVPFVLA